MGKIDCYCNNNFENDNFYLPLEIFILSPFIHLLLFKKANMLRLLSSIIFKLEPFAMFERPSHAFKSFKKSADLKISVAQINTSIVYLLKAE